jgi:hypothetical protein
MIWSWTSILVELKIVETPIYGLTIYSLQTLYGFTLVQSIIFYEETHYLQWEIYPSICIYPSFFVVNSRACDFMFSQFVVYALLLSNLYINFFLNKLICISCILYFAFHVEWSPLKVCSLSIKEFLKIIIIFPCDHSKAHCEAFGTKKE